MEKKKLNTKTKQKGNLILSLYWEKAILQNGQSLFPSTNEDKRKGAGLRRRCVLKLGEGNMTLIAEGEGAEPSVWLTVFFPRGPWTAWQVLGSALEEGAKLPRCLF